MDDDSLMAQLQQQGLSLEGTWAPEQPVRLDPIQFARLFSGQKMTLRNIRRAVRMGLVAVDGASIVVKSPKFLEIGIELTRLGIGIDEILDEFEELQAMTDAIAERFTRVFEHNMWEPFVAAGLPADQAGQLTESLQRLTALAEDVVQSALRDALRRQATDFLAAQAIGRTPSCGAAPPAG